MTVEPEIRVLISREEIAAAVSRLAGEITRDYHDKHPLVVGILKGSFIFLADLTRRLDFPLEIDFVQASSYGRGAAESSGELKLLLPLRTPPRGRHVILIEDIIEFPGFYAILCDPSISVHRIATPYRRNARSLNRSDKWR